MSVSVNSKAKSLVLWCLVNIGLGAIPLIMMVICRSIARHPLSPLFEYIPEITFLTVMSVVGVIRDLTRVPERKADNVVAQVLFILLLITAILGAGVLGIYYCGTIITQMHYDELVSMFNASRVAAFATVTLCLLVEALGVTEAHGSEGVPES